MESGYCSTAGSPESFVQEIIEPIERNTFGQSTAQNNDSGNVQPKTDVGTSTIELKKNNIDDTGYDSDPIEDNVLSQSYDRVSDSLRDEHIILENIISDRKLWTPAAKDPNAYHDMFIKRRQWVIDNPTYRTIIGRWGKLKTISELVKLIRVHTHRKPLIDQVWFVFYWITMNINQDTATTIAGKSMNQSPNIVFQARKGTYVGYASLFKRICTQIGIQCEYITGYTKIQALKHKKGIKSQPDHAWNAIRIEHKWYLMDTMWAAGYLIDNTTKFERHFDAFYFLSRPEQFIYSHLPKSPRWQLLKETLSMTQYSKVPTIYPTYFKLGLELVIPRIQQKITLLPNEPFTMLTLRAPSKVLLSGYLTLDDQKVKGAHYIEFLVEKNLWKCYFAPRSIGRHKIIICVSDRSENEGIRAIELNFDVTCVPNPTTSFPNLWHAFFMYKMEIIYPRNTHTISLHSPNNNHSQVLIRTPMNIELKGSLFNSDGTNVKGGDRVYFDRHKNIWRCKFAPNKIGIYEAYIFARQKSNSNDNNDFIPVIVFELPVNHLEAFISYPELAQCFFDLNLRLISPTSQQHLILEKKLAFAQICIHSPTNVYLVCHTEYCGQKLKDASFLQFNYDKKCWECLFAPQCAAVQQCVISARSVDERSKLAAKFDLNITRFIRPIIFPLTYPKFNLFQCYIFEPLEGLLTPGSTLNFRYRLPGARKAFFEVDSDRGKAYTLAEPLFEQLITVGRVKVTLFVQFEIHFEPLVRYSVKSI